MNKLQYTITSNFSIMRLLKVVPLNWAVTLRSPVNATLLAYLSVNSPYSISQSYSHRLTDSVVYVILFCPLS